MNIAQNNEPVPPAAEALMSIDTYVTRVGALDTDETGVQVHSGYEAFRSKLMEHYEAEGKSNHKWLKTAKEIYSPY